jgi:Family of unknown function (DUF6166)
MKNWHQAKREVAMNTTDRRYEGRRTPDGVEVWVVKPTKRTRLEPRRDVWDHSPTGFEWGYGGSGPAQLALALLLDALQDVDLAIELHQLFKWERVAALPREWWAIDRQAIVNWAYSRDQRGADEAAGKADADSGIDLRLPLFEVADEEGRKP